MPSACSSPGRARASPLCREPGEEFGFCPWQRLIVINNPRYLLCGGGEWLQLESPNNQGCSFLL